jgi:uncharacterized Zn-binding protein involved in type VI secretion
MSAAARLGDFTTGEPPCFPATPIETNCSPDVLINGIAAALIGSGLPPHTCDKTTHSGRVVVSGSSTVIINGRAAARIGDKINCGDTIAEGSPDVIIG